MNTFDWVVTIIALLAGGFLLLLNGLGASMTDGAPPAWGGYVFFAGIASFALGLGLAAYKIGVFINETWRAWH